MQQLQESQPCSTAQESRKIQHCLHSSVSKSTVVTQVLRQRVGSQTLGAERDDCTAVSAQQYLQSSGVYTAALARSTAVMGESINCPAAAAFALLCDL